ATQRRARELGLTGWVCNRTDGSVYLEAHGPQAALDALLDWLREGPPLARVDELCVEEGSGGPSEDFEIRADRYCRGGAPAVSAGGRAAIAGSPTGPRSAQGAHRWRPAGFQS